MGRGKRIENFRNLNLNSFEIDDDKPIAKQTKTKKKQNKKTTRNTTNATAMLEKEMIIEVQEKPREKKNKYENTRLQSNKKIQSNKKQNKNNQTTRVSQSRNIEAKQSQQIKSQKNKSQKSNHTSIIVSSFLLILVLIGVVAGCLVTPTFDVTFIEVNEGTHVTSGEIQRFFSEAKGKNTFLVNTKELEKNIETLPYIYKATINRKLPSTLSVNYIERKPYAIVKYIESYILTDKYANILEIKKENQNPELPIIYGIEEEEFVPGNKLTSIAKLKFENTVYLLETAEHIDFNYTITEINYTDAEEIVLSIAESNIQIIYGKMEKDIINDKMTYLGEILKKLTDKKGTLDISSTNYSEKVIFTEILK